MDEALIQVGLPVKCVWGDCNTKGFVKPWTDYGGWGRRSRTKWYCPAHAKKAQELYDDITERYKTPDPGLIPADTEAELYKLLD